MSYQNLSSGDLLADRRFAYVQGLLQDRDFDAAADLLTQTLDRVPEWAPAWIALGNAEHGRGRLQEARAAYRRAERLDTAGRFGAGLHLARLDGGACVAGMPDTYVAALFDDYAARFDRHLTGELHYRGPDLLRQALTEVCGPRRFAHALDLGCGTGLMGAAIRERTDRLDGVDLSPAMIGEAERKGLYDGLAVDDVVRHLEGLAERTLDLVLAADMFVYLGALGPVLTETARVLTTGGLLAFTVQNGGQDMPQLGEDLRFSHSVGYLDGRLREAGLTPQRVEHASTRRERGEPVPGLVVVACKP